VRNATGDVVIGRLLREIKNPLSEKGREGYSRGATLVRPYETASLIRGCKRATPSALLTVATPARTTYLAVFALATPQSIRHLRLYRLRSMVAAL